MGFPIEMGIPGNPVGMGIRLQPGTGTGKEWDWILHWMSCILLRWKCPFGPFAFNKLIDWLMWGCEWPLFPWEKFPRIYSRRLASGWDLCAVALFRFHRSLPDMKFWRITVEIFLSDIQSTVNDVIEFFLFFNDCCPFSVHLCFCCSTVDCLHLHIVVLLCVFVNETGMEMA